MVKSSTSALIASLWSWVQRIEEVVEEAARYLRVCLGPARVGVGVGLLGGGGGRCGGAGRGGRRSAPPPAAPSGESMVSAEVGVLHEVQFVYWVDYGAGAQVEWLVRMRVRVVLHFQVLKAHGV